MAFSEKTYEPVAAKVLTKQAASWGPVLKALGALLTVGEAASVEDAINYTDSKSGGITDWLPFVGAYDAYKSGDKGRQAAAVHAALLSTSGAAMGKAVKGTTGMYVGAGLGGAIGPSLTSVERAATSARMLSDTQRNIAEKGNQNNNGVTTAPNVTVSKGNDWATAAAISLGAAGLLGLGGWGLYEWLKARQEDKARDSRMKMRIKTPNGDDAVVDVPLVNPNMSPQLEEDFNRGVTRGVRQIARHNSFKRDPQTGKLMKYQDWYNQYGRLEEEGNTSAGDMGKAANVVNMPRLNLLEGTVPPAQEGTNPPVRTGFVRSYLDSLTKRASRERKTNEATGGVTAPLLTAALAGLAAKAMGAGNGTALGAAGVAGVAAPLVGTALAATRPVRAQAEQDRIDAEGSGWENWLVPGLAQYNQVQRARVLPNALAVATRAAAGDEIPDIDGDGEPDVVPERMTITRDSLSPMKLDDDF